MIKHKYHNLSNKVKEFQVFFSDQHVMQLEMNTDKKGGELCLDELYGRRIDFQ